MKQRAEFSEKQGEYKYMPLGNGMADVFIRKFIEEKKEVNEDGIETVLFVYNQNEFRVNETEITEDMIKEDPMTWLDYNPSAMDIPLLSRIEALEEAILEIGEVMYNG